MASEPSVRIGRKAAPPHAGPSVPPTSAASRDRRRRLGFAAVVAGALCIAFAPIFVRLSHIPPTATAFQRMLLALPLYAGWILLDRTSRPRRGADRSARLRRTQLMGLVLAGVFFAGDLATWHFSLWFTSVTNATLMANMAPVFVTLVAWWVFREHVSGMFLLGLALALGGAALLMRASLDLGHRHLAGDALGLLTACFYAGYLLSVKRLRDSMGTAQLMGASTLVSCVVLLAVAAALGEQLFPVDLRGWLVVLGLAWTSQVAGQGLIAYGMAHLPASFSAVTLLVQPAAVALLGWMILGEGLSWWQGAGGVAVLAGILLARRAST